MKSLGPKILALLFAVSLAPAAMAADPESRTRPRPPRQALWECVTRNVRGDRFYAIDPIRNWAQARAQNKCQRRSYACRALGCYKI
jgi:hypothetical protein